MGTIKEIIEVQDNLMNLITETEISAIMGIMMVIMVVVGEVIANIMVLINAILQKGFRKKIKDIGVMDDVDDMGNMIITIGAIKGWKERCK